MSKVIAIMSMSLDGYVADLNDGAGVRAHAPHPRWMAATQLDCTLRDRRHRKRLQNLGFYAERVLFSR